MIDLQPESLDLVKEILKDHIPGRVVWAFGSRINGKAKEFSDLDLAIHGSENLSNETLLNLKLAFSESDLPIKVDLVEFNDVSETFREIIRGHYEVIQEG